MISEIMTVRMQTISSVYNMKKKIGLNSTLSTKKSITKTIVLIIV